MLVFFFLFFSFSDCPSRYVSKATSSGVMHVFFFLSEIVWIE